MPKNPAMTVSGRKQLVKGNVDMVLYGHVHERVEFRIRLDGDGLRGCARTSTRRTRPLPRELGLDPCGERGRGAAERRARIFLRVDADARAGATPRETTDHRPDGLPSNAPEGTIMVSRNLAIPAYDDPLSDANDETAWVKRLRHLGLEGSDLLDRDVEAAHLPEAAEAGARPRLVDELLVCVTSARERESRQELIARATPAGVEPGGHLALHGHVAVGCRGHKSDRRERWSLVRGVRLHDEA
jgi:hypothetical protein